MNITLASGLYPSEIGGPASYAHLLESELPARDITVTTVPLGWVRRYPKILRPFVYLWKLWRESKTTDVIYALDPVTVGVPALIVSRLRRKPLLVRLSGDYAWEQGRVRFGLQSTLDEYTKDSADAPWLVRLLARVQSYVVSRADSVVVSSQYLKSIVVQWGIHPDNIFVIYSALYQLEVTGDKETLRNQLEYSYPTIISAARLVPWKGFRVLIDAVRTLQQTFPDISLVIVGEGEERAKLESQVAKYQLTDRVRFTGSISKEALGASIKAADVFVLNTAYEGLSHQLIEVMDLGVPIVTTRSGGNPELITDGVHGYLVDFNTEEQLVEAISRVLHHPESQTRITQSARGRSKDFQKSVVLNDIEQLLKRFE